MVPLVGRLLPSAAILIFAMPIMPPMDGHHAFNDFPPEQWTEYVQVSHAENWQEMFDREETSTC